MNQVIILAAGKGRRMKSETPKVLVKLHGQAMIEYLIKSVLAASLNGRPLIMTAPDNQEIIKAALGNYDLEYGLQLDTKGTGDAVACARKFIPADRQNIIVLYGDHPFIKPQTLKDLVAAHRGPLTMMTTRVKDFDDWRQNFYHWGRIVRAGDQIKEIVEYKDANDEQREIKEVNPALYCFDAAWLWSHIDLLTDGNQQGEYYLTDLVKIATAENCPINHLEIDPREAMGVNTAAELAVAEGLLQD